MINLSDPTWILAIGTVGGAILALVVWLVRLEGRVTFLGRETAGKVKTLSDAQQKMEQRTDVIIDKIFGQLSGIQISIAKIEGRLSNDTLKSTGHKKGE